jgi:hypothetical protein
MNKRNMKELLRLFEAADKYLIEIGWIKDTKKDRNKKLNRILNVKD